MAYMQARNQALLWMNKWDNISMACGAPHYSMKFLLRQSEGWWQAHACYQVQSARAYFLRENIMSDACHAVSTRPSQRVRYIRNTVYVAGISGAIVQDTFAEIDDKPVDCRQPIITIASGRQTLRWLR